MTFGQIQGNEDVKQALTGMVGAGRVPHAILFHEDDGGGAFPLTVAFLQLLFGESNRIPKFIHPDVHYVFPTAAGSISLQYMDKFRTLALENPFFTESAMGDALGIEGRNSMIAVSEAKHILDALSLSAMEGGYRAVVIYLPEKMNQEAANRLLKIIEEPPQKTQFVLITHKPEKVLLTISSRCQRIRVRPSGKGGTAGYEEAPLLDDLMKALLSRDLLSALEVGDRIAALPSRESAKAFCRYAAGVMRDIFLFQQGLPSLAGKSGSSAEWASACRRTFPRVASEILSGAIGMIDRNVNIKIISTDIVDRLYQAI